MPIYAYQCQACHRLFELTQSIHDLPVNQCVHCAGRVQRVIQPATLDFRGNGWTEKGVY